MKIPAIEHGVAAPTKVAGLPQDKKSRLRLASELLKILPAKLQQPPSIETLTDTFVLSENLLQQEHPRLKDTYGVTFQNHLEAVKQWLQCLKILTEFYKSSTKFEGNLSTREAFLIDIPGGPPDNVINMFLDGMTALNGWQEKRQINDGDFSKEVASVFYHLALWPVFVPLAKVEQMTLGFTTELLAWFR